MAPETVSLSLTEWIVLALVAEGDRHGFAVAQELQRGSALGTVWTVHRPLVYRAVAHLESLGLIRRAGTERGRQGPERTLLQATTAGRRRVAHWLRQPVDHPRLVRTELLAKFVLLARTEKALRPLADRQLEHFASLFEGIEDSADRATGSGRIVATWRLESVRSTERFLERVIRGEFEPRAYDAVASKR